jgi:hypothetical protein
MVRYILEQRVFVDDTHVTYVSARKCRRKLLRKFRDERVLCRQIIHILVNKLRTTGLLRARLEDTPRKSLKNLGQETGLSKPGARMATQLLKFRPYKTTVNDARLAAARFS